MFHSLGTLLLATRCNVSYCTLGGQLPGYMQTVTHSCMAPCRAIEHKQQSKPAGPCWTERRIPVIAFNATESALPSSKMRLCANVWHKGWTRLHMYCSAVLPCLVLEARSVAYTGLE